MKNFNGFNRIDLLAIVGAGLFFFSCFATTLQTARTKAPGQAELSAGYMQVRSMEEFSDPPIQLLGVNGRLGVARNFDAGFEHTFDFSEDNESYYNTIWGDVKYQFTNQANELNKLTVSSGLVKGYLYKEDMNVHRTAIPLYFSLPVNSKVTPTFMYRYSLISDGFLSGFEDYDPLHVFSIGAEFCLKEPDPAKWIPKFAVSVGTIQSFQEGDDGMFLFNFGFKFDSPFKIKE